MSKALSNQLRILRQRRAALASGDTEEYNRLTDPQQQEEQEEKEEGVETLEEEKERPLDPRDPRALYPEETQPSEPKEDKPLEPRIDWKALAPGEIPGEDSPSFQDVQKIRGPNSTLGSWWASWRDMALEDSREGAERSAAPINERRGELALSQMENAAIGSFLASKVHPILAVPTALATAYASLTPTVAGLVDSTFGTDLGSRASGFGGDPLDPTQWLFGTVFPSWTAQKLQNDLDAEIVQYYPEGSKERVEAEKRLAHKRKIDTLHTVVQDNYAGELASGQFHDVADAEHYLNSATKNESLAHRAEAAKTAKSLEEMDQALADEFGMQDIPRIAMFSDTLGRGVKAGLNLTKAERHLYHSVLKRIVSDNPNITNEDAQDQARKEVEVGVRMALQSHPFLQSTSIIRLDTENSLEDIVNMGKRGRESLAPYGLGDMGQFLGDTFSPFSAILTAPSLLSKDGLTAPEQIATESVLASGARIFNLAFTTLWGAGAKFDKYPVIGPSLAALGLISREDAVLNAEELEWLMMGSDAADAAPHVAASFIDHIYPDGMPGSRQWNEGYAKFAKDHPFIAQAPILIPAMLMEPDALSLSMGPLGKVAKTALHNAKSIKYSAYIDSLEGSVEELEKLKGVLDPFITEVDGVKTYKDIPPETQAEVKDVIRTTLNRVLSSSEDPEIQDFLITNIQTRLNTKTAKEVAIAWNKARESRRMLVAMQDDTGVILDAQEKLGTDLKDLELDMQAATKDLGIREDRLRLVVEAIRKTLPKYFTENDLSVKKVKKLNRADLQKVIEDTSRDLGQAIRDLEGLIVRNGDAFEDEAILFARLQKEQKLLQQAHEIAKKGLILGDEVSILGKGPDLESGKFIRYEDVDGAKQAIIRIGEVDRPFDPELIVFNEDAMVRRLNPAYGKAPSAAGREFITAIKGVFFRGEQGTHTAADGSVWRKSSRGLKKSQTVRWIKDGESQSVDEFKVVEDKLRDDGTAWVEIEPKVGTAIVVPKAEVYSLMARDVKGHLDMTLALLEARARAATLHRGEEVTEEAMNAWYKRNFYGVRAEGEATQRLFEGEELAAQGDALEDIMYQGPATAGAATAEEAVEAARLWKELGTESPYFKKWFGDSKLVGEDGKPLVLFHGGAQGLMTLLPAGGSGAPKGSAMAPGVQSVGRAIYTTMDEQEARRHVSMTAGQQLRARAGVWGNSPRRGQTGMPDKRDLGLYKMYARLESPLDLRKPMVDSPQDVKNLRAILQEVRRLEAARTDIGSASLSPEEVVKHLDYVIKNFEERVADPTMRPYSGEPISPKASLGEMFNEDGLIGSTMDLSAVFKKYGYDGVISDPKWQVPEVVVFDSNQVKSAAPAGFPRANRGTFDETGRLLFQGADEPASVDDIVKVLFQEGDEGARMPWERGDPTTRVPELAAAAKKILAGTADAPTRAQYQKLVDEYKPVYPYASVPAPATRADMVRGLSASDKKKVEKIDGAANLEAGTVVGLRLDIPAYKREKVWVPTIHRRSTVIGHHAAAAVDNVKLTMGGTTALKIAAGEIAKTPFATIKGGWSPATTEDLVAEAEAALKSDDWVQVGMDPERHSFFYDRKTQQPLGSADRVIQIGPLVLAKNAKPLDPKKEARLLYQDAEEVPVFYSKLIETTKGMPKRMLIGDYEKWLYKRGVKEVEVNATNLDVYLEELASKGEKFAYKADLEKFLDENQVKVTLQDFGKSAPSGRLLTPYTRDLARVERELSRSIKFANLPYTFRYRLFEQTNEGVQEFLQSPSRFKKQRSELVEDLDELLNVYNQIVHNPDFTAGTDAATRKLQGDVRRLIIEHGEADYTQVGKGISREKLKEVQNVLDELGTTEQGMRKAYATSNMLDTRDQLTFMQSLIDSKDFKEYARLRDLQQKYVSETENLKGTRYQKWVQDGYDDYQELIIELDNPRAGDFDTPHFNRTNILAHARMTSRTTPEGKKVLMIDELQSDWHQAGRQYGYKGDADVPSDAEYLAAWKDNEIDDFLEEVKKSYAKIDDPKFSLDSIEDAVRKISNAPDSTKGLDHEWGILGRAEPEFRDDDIDFNRIHDIEDALRFNSQEILYDAGFNLLSRIPDAPFKSTSAWLTLLMKPIMKRAADEGYDAVAITPPQWAEKVGMPADAAKAFYGYLPLTEKQFRAKAVREVKDWDDDILAETFDEYARVAVLNDEAKFTKGSEYAQRQSWLNGEMSFSPQELFARLMDSYGEDFATDLAVKAYSETASYSEAADPLVGIKGIVSGVLKKYTKGKIYTGKVSAGSISRSPGAPPELQRFLADDVFEPVMMMDLTDKVKKRVSKTSPLFHKPDKKLPPKAGVSFVQDNKAILHAFSQPDVSSVVHEIAHVFRRDLRRSGWQGKIDNDILQKAYGVEVLDADHMGWAHLGLNPAQVARAYQRGAKDKYAPEWSGPGDWSVEAEERFARDFEKYLADGRSPSLELDGVFKKFKAWMAEIYVKIAGSDIKGKLPDEVREVFNRMLTGAMTTEGYMGFTAPQLRKQLLARGLKPEKYDGTKGRPVKLDYAKALARDDASKTSDYTRFSDAQALRAKNANKKPSTLVPGLAATVKATKEELKALSKPNKEAKKAAKKYEEKIKTSKQLLRDSRREQILAKAVEESEASKKAFKDTSEAWYDLLKKEDKSAQDLRKHLKAISKKWESSKYVEEDLIPALDASLKDLRSVIDLLQKEKIRPPRRNLLKHPLVKSAVRNRKEGTWEINPKAFVEAVDEFYVDGVLDNFVDSTMGVYLETILRASQDGTKVLRFNNQQMKGVRKSLSHMEDLYRAGSLSSEAWGQFQLIQNTFRTKKFAAVRIPIPFSDMVNGKGVLIKDQIGATKFFWDYYKLLDPDYTAFGKMSKPLARTAVRHERYLEAGMGDFHNVNQQHLGGDFMGAHIELMDSNVAQKGRYGYTITNTMGDGIFQEGRRFILNNLERDEKGKIKFEKGEQGSYMESLVHSLERMFLPQPQIRTATKVPEKRAAAARKKMLDILGTEGMTYARFIRELQEATGGSPSLRQSARGITMASRALLDASAMQHTIKAMANEKFGVLTAQEGLQLSRWLSGEVKSVDDVDALWRAAQKTGMDLSEATLRPSTGPEESEKAIVKDIIKWNLDDGVKATSEEIAAHNQKIADKLGTTLSEEEISGLQAVKGTRVTDPRQVFMPSHLITTMSGGDVKYVKELDTLYSSPKSINPTRALQSLSRLWKGSVTSGLLLPRPKYFVNNMIGDLSQIWMHHGLTTAAKVSTQNIFSNIPYVGPSIQNVASEMSSKLTGVPVLGTAINAVFNPVIGKIFGAREGVVEIGKETVSLSTLRENLALDGVLDTFTSRELEANIHQAGQALADMEIQSARRQGKSLPGKVKEQLIQKFRYDLDAFATQVQQRQRVGLYLEMRNKGLSHDQAVAEVKDALYDWSKGFAKWETHYVMGFLSPFYRFWKLAGKQMIQAALEPFVMDSNEYMLKALTGRTRLARAKNQSRILAGIPSWAANAQANAADEEDRADVYYKSKLAKQYWTKPGSTFWGEPASEKARQFYLTEKGRTGIDTISHTMSSPATAAEMLSLGLFVSLTPLAALRAATQEDEVFNSVRASAQLKKYAVELGGPILAAFIESDPSYQGEFKRINEGQATMLNLLAPEFSNIHYDKQHRKVANSTAVAILDLLPVLGTHIPDAVHGWDISRATYDDDETMKRLIFAIASLSGPVREYATSSKDQLYYGHKEVEDLIKKAASHYATGVSPQEVWVVPE